MIRLPEISSMYPTKEDLERDLLKVAFDAVNITLYQYRNPITVLKESGQSSTLAAFIYSYIKTHGILCPLSEDVFSAVNFTVRKNLLSLEKLIHVSCLLNFIDYPDVKSDDDLYPVIINQLENKMMASNLAAAGLFACVMGLFSLRKVTVEKSNLFSLFCKRIYGNVSCLTPVEITLALKGLVQANYKYKTLFEELRASAISIHHRFTLNQAVYTIWSCIYAEMKQGMSSRFDREENRRLIHTFRARLTEEMNTLCVEQAVRIAWCFNALNIADHTFFNAVNEKINNERKALDPLKLSHLTKILSETSGNNDLIHRELLALFIKNTE